MILLKLRLFRLILVDYFTIIAGCALYAVGFSVFIEPNSIVVGGATGVATLIHQFVYFLPIGFTIILINLPLFIIGFLKFKGEFLFKTIISTALSSVFIDIFVALLPQYTGDVILSVLAGGVTMGTGLALVMLRGATTGGTDIVAKLANRKFRFIPIGRLMFFVDVLIVCLSGVIYKRFEPVLYSVLFLFVSTFVLDKLIYGSGNGKLLFVVTKNPAEITAAITATLGRGATEIKAKGGYTGTDISVLMCAVRPSQVSRLLNIVKSTDKDSFVVITEAGEILGLGFKSFDM